MSQNKRIGLAMGIVLVIVLVVTAVDTWRRNSMAAELNITPGSIPIYYGGNLIGGVVIAELESLPTVSFVDAEKGKTQEGWLLQDVFLLYLPTKELSPESQITVSSSSRGKTAVLTWAEVQNPDNNVLFDLSGAGTLKLVSTLENLDTRDEWVQDTDKIEIEP
ncbi:MAG: hypothetical protein CSA11_10250 [Chloroflexi bacterium]|nr:MAG: hypothetical protein CSB13_00915 [Chloroflexota bacterium]PIE79922.1 MAG: hypothetical protein CSA11_10250 [Chloroflexota bacterium]